MSDLPPIAAAPPAQPPSPQTASQPLPPASEQDSTAAPLKPLPNPLQNDGPPPSSTIVEAPKSPNPANPATDDRGNNVEVPVTNGEVANAQRTANVAAPEPLPVAAEQPAAPAPTPAPAPVAAPVDDQPPLPIDAPVPPSPKAHDEAPPALPAGTIPSAVPTPSVITTEEQERKGGILGVEEAAAVPTPVSETQAPPPAEPASDAMDVDAVGEADVEAPSSAPGLESSVSETSLKRAGDDLEESREEKRLREDALPAESSNTAPAPTEAAPPAQPQAAPSEPAVAPSAPEEGAAPVPPPAWHSYVPPAPRPAGPTTPLTPTQHRHFLTSVRAIKKRQADSVFFAQPVDTVLFGIPHYPQIIDRPMDLGTVETKLVASDPRGPPKDKSKAAKWDMSKGTYKSVSEITEDVRQIWENSRKFNGKDHPISQAATRLEEYYEKQLANIPSEPAPPAAPSPRAPAAGPSTARRASISQPPVIRRTSDDTRPKREIHPPPSKDLAYEDIGGTRKPKRRNDVQLQWAARTLKSLEVNQKTTLIVEPFIYPVEDIIRAIPDYTIVIKQPIDLNQIKGKLTEGVYEDVAQLDDDIKLMLANAQKFNPPDHDVHRAAIQFLQLWGEKWKGLPPKQEVREESEDPLAEEYVEAGYSSEEDNTTLRSLESKVSELNDQIAALRAKIAKRRASRATKPKAKSAKSGSSQRKQSVSKHSPGINGNGHSKKPKKVKETAVSYQDDDEDMESDDEPTTMTLTQKQELAEKIQLADADTLQKAITIIQQTTNLGANNEEIELDIDSLPTATVLKLYNLVCRGGRSGKAGRPKGQLATGAQGKKAAKKAIGGASRKSVNEREEAERIKRMEAQLQSFDSGRGGGGGGAVGGYEGEESSSEEESSDEE
ncbi:hypothetical protein CI109_106817 [Kwoniella shandongensis]|uniref:Uncharacterized protein n=1 Tax=Kwoniella shandongensis TaxID=1734106 RepID=A0A5M6C6K3_9TREE|nr:uncharacterized protein CI109_000926 [Kwoniella shandongensis]KAA5530746.1 hypothetical protein CI109_000926 [Kwoniella shandongensis]